MRVTNQMIFEAARLQTGSARDKAMEAQERVATGLKPSHPGDHPSAAGAAIALGLSVRRFDAINQQVGRAISEAEVADGAWLGVSDLLARARQLAVQLGNDSYSADERLGGAQEIRDIIGQVAQYMNTEVAGRYLFGGNVDNTRPFDATGNYVGDTAVRQVEVAPGLLQNASVRADVAMKGAGGGVDVFASLTTLANALASNDGSGVRGSLTGLVASGDQVATALTQNGGIMDGFFSAQNIGTVAKDSSEKLHASVTEVDIFEAASGLARAQQSLEAALAVSAKSFNLSLLDFLPR